MSGGPSRLPRTARRCRRTLRRGPVAAGIPGRHSRPPPRPSSRPGRRRSGAPVGPCRVSGSGAEREGRPDPVEAVPSGHLPSDLQTVFGECSGRETWNRTETTMTDDRMTLMALVQKSADMDPVRDVLAHCAELLMEMERSRPRPPRPGRGGRMRRQGHHRGLATAEPGGRRRRRKRGATLITLRDEAHTSRSALGHAVARVPQNGTLPEKGAVRSHPYVSVSANGVHRQARMEPRCGVHARPHRRDA